MKISITRSAFIEETRGRYFYEILDLSTLFIIKKLLYNVISLVFKICLCFSRELYELLMAGTKSLLPNNTNV
jgi:hypothetical protein